MMKIRWHSVIILVSFVLLLVGGTFIYHSIEGWGYLDSAYFLVITSTTIGYGDLTPQTNLGKIITMAYSLVGIAFVFYIISLISHQIFDKRIQVMMTDVSSDKRIVRRATKKR